MALWLGLLSLFLINKGCTNENNRFFPWKYTHSPWDAHIFWRMAVPFSLKSLDPKEHIDVAARALFSLSGLGFYKTVSLMSRCDNHSIIDTFSVQHKFIFWITVIKPLCKIVGAHWSACAHRLKLQSFCHIFNSDAYLWLNVPVSRAIAERPDPVDHHVSHSAR